MWKQGLFFFIILLLGSGCLEIKNSVFGTETRLLRNWNAKFKVPSYNLAGGDIVRFAVFSDSHQNYSDLYETILTINQTGVGFSVFTGDFSDIGTRDEYEIFLSFMEDLTAPSWVVPGNHDLATLKNRLFTKIFGLENHSLVTSFGKLIFWNSNALEMRPETVDLDFLDAEIASADPSAPVFIFQHQDPYNALTYLPSEMTRYTNLVNSHPQVFIFHGHLHQFFRTQVGTTGEAFQVSRVEGVKWAYAEIDNTQIRVFYCKKKDCEKVYENAVIFSPMANRPPR